MKQDDIKTPEDILEYMDDNIEYGWLDINNEEHIGNMKNFRKLYRTSSLEETISHGLGTCIEQVFLMSHLLNDIDIWQIIRDRVINKITSSIGKGKDYAVLSDFRRGARTAELTLPQEQVITQILSTYNDLVDKDFLGYASDYISSIVPIYQALSRITDAATRNRAFEIISSGNIKTSEGVLAIA